MKVGFFKSRVSNASYAMSLCSALILAGCATEVAKKPETTTQASSSAAPSTARSGTGKSEVSSGQAGSGSSSLDALREGKSASSGPLKDIYFDFDKYDLSAEARAVLKANADWLRANVTVNVEIEGHCDERGTTEYNLALGAKRARSAMDYLVSLGVAPTRIKTVSYGEEIPVCREKSEECYQKNRHDRFIDRRTGPGA